MKNLICVDKGALKMALNILERGSDLHKQAAEALKQSCTDHIQQLEADKAEIKTAYEVGKLTIKNAMKEANELSGKVYDLEVKEIALEDKIKQLQSELAEAREANSLLVNSIRSLKVISSKSEEGREIIERAITKPE